MFLYLTGFKLTRIKCNQRVLPRGLFITSMLQNSDPISRYETNLEGKLSEFPSYCKFNFNLLVIVENYKKYYGNWGDPTSQPIGIIQKLVRLTDIEVKSVL